MKEWNLKNPHDPYTFLAGDLEVATLVVFLLGIGYGAEEKDGDGSVPIFIFAGVEESERWYMEHFNRKPEEGFEARKQEVADALATMMYGYFDDRQRYEEALEAITDAEKRDEFIEKWQDSCSSMTNIGAFCHRLAQKLRSEE